MAAGIFLLGRHVERRAGVRAGQRAQQRAPAVVIHHLCQAQVADLNVAVFAVQQVGGLDIPVHRAEFVDGAQPLADFQSQPHHARQGQAAAVLQLIRQAAARRVLHHQSQHAILVFEIIDPDDVGMVKHGAQLGLELKALGGLEVIFAAHARRIAPQQFDGAPHAQPCDAVHLTKRPAVDVFLDAVFIAEEGVAGVIRHQV